MSDQNELEKNGQANEKPGMVKKVVDRFRDGSDNKALLGWRDSEDVIAVVVPKEKMASQLFFRKKFNVHPGEAALLMKKGRMEKIVEEGQIIVAGVLDRLKKAVGAGEDLALMMIDTSELILRVHAGIQKGKMLTEDEDLYLKIHHTLQRRPVTPRRVAMKGNEKNQDVFEAEEKAIEHNIESQSLVHNTAGEKTRILDDLAKIFGVDDDSDTPLLTKDRESIVLDVKILVNFQPEHAKEIFKLVNRVPDKRLTIPDLQRLVGQELSVRVFAPRLMKHTAEELRKNLDIIGQMQKEAEVELFRWLANYGIQLNRLSINPAVTDHERTAVIEKEKQALEELAKNQHERDLRTSKREYELLILREELASQIQIANRKNDEELEKIARIGLLADGEKDLTLEQIEGKKKEIGIQIKAKEEQLRLLVLERKAAIENEKDRLKSENKIKEMQAWFEQIRKNKAVKSKLKIDEKKAQLEIIRVEQRHVETLFDKAAQQNAVTPDVAIGVIRQATNRKALDQGDGAAKAFAMAEGQRHSKEIFKEGIAHQAPIGVAGKGPFYLQSGGTMVQSNIPGIEHQTGQLPDPSKQSKIGCNHCDKQIPVDSNVCPYCGEKIQSESPETIIAN